MTVRTAFDLASGPVWRARLLRLAAEEHVLVVVVHHVATDGGSSAILVRDLAELYAAARRGTPPVLPALPVSYADYATWERDWLAGNGHEQRLAYWRATLRDAPRLRIGGSPQPPPAALRTADRAGLSAMFEIGPFLRAALIKLGQAADATPFMVLLAAYDVLLYQHTGQTDLPVGTDVSDRPFGEVENVVGPFVNQVVLRTRLADLPSFRELLGRVRGICRDGQANQDVPVEAVVAALNPERDRGAPLFDVEIVFAALSPARRLADLVVEPVAVPVHAAKHDLTLFLNDDGERFSGSFLGAADVLETAQVATLRDRFLDLLEHCAADPDERIHRLGGAAASFRQLVPTAVWASDQVHGGSR